VIDIGVGQQNRLYRRVAHAAARMQPGEAFDCCRMSGLGLGEGYHRSPSALTAIED